MPRLSAHAGIAALLVSRRNDAQLACRVEKAVFGWGLVNPILTLPELHNIFVLKNTAGFSAVSIAAALIMAALWALHGLLARQRVVWVTSSIWVVVNAATLLGVLWLS